MTKSSILLTSGICRSDKFLDLSFEAQALYLQACFECDSYGLFSNPKTLLRTTGNSNEALGELIKNGFLISVEHNQTLYFVVRNWWQINKLDRTKFNNPPLVEVMNLCTINGSNELHLILEASEMGLIEVEKGESEGLPNIKMYGSPELVPDQSRSSPEGETNSNVTNSNSNEHNETEINDRRETTSCPQCDGEAVFAHFDAVDYFLCPNCGLFRINSETGEIERY